MKGEQMPTLRFLSHPPPSRHARKKGDEEGRSNPLRQKAVVAGIAIQPPTVLSARDANQLPRAISPRSIWVGMMNRSIYLQSIWPMPWPEEDGQRTVSSIELLGEMTPTHQLQQSRSLPIAPPSSTRLIQTRSLPCWVPIQAPIQTTTQTPAQ